MSSLEIGAVSHLDITRSTRIGLIRRLWIGLIVFVPIIPKVAVFYIGGVALLLDDLMMICGICLGAADFFGVAILSGQSKFTISRIGIVLLLVALYKTVVLFLLSLVYPWGDLSTVGSALLLEEGFLVVIRINAMAAVYLLFFNFLRRMEEIHYVMRLYLFTIIVVVVIGLLQNLYLGHPVMTSTFRNIHALGQIIPGVWGLENPWLDVSSTGHEHLGAFMIFALSILGGCLLYQWPLKLAHRRWVTVLCLVGIYVLLMSSSRGAWVGAISAGGAFFGLSIKRRRFSFLNRFVLLICLGIGCLYIVDFDFAYHVGRRVEKLPAILDGKILDDSGLHRIELLKSLWAMFLDKPLLGWGAGGAGRIAEGQFIRELVEGGVVGGFLFLFLMAICGTIAIKTNRITLDPLAKGLSLGFACGLIGFLGHCLFTELFILPKVSVSFWVLAAVVHRIYFIERKRIEDNESIICN